MQRSADDHADPRARRREWRRLVGARGCRELALFAAVYALYDAARWLFAGRLPAARAHADWIIDLERSLHVSIEGSVQRALDWGVTSWLLANVYLAAQLVVLPGALIWLYHRSPPVYRRLRNTVIGAWLLGVPIFALFPVAPPRLADIGMPTPSAGRPQWHSPATRRSSTTPTRRCPACTSGSRSRSASPPTPRCAPAGQRRLRSCGVRSSSWP